MRRCKVYSIIKAVHLLIYTLKVNTLFRFMICLIVWYKLYNICNITFKVIV